MKNLRLIKMNDDYMILARSNSSKIMSKDEARMELTQLDVYLEEIDKALVDLEKMQSGTAFFGVFKTYMYSKSLGELSTEDKS